MQLGLALRLQSFLGLGGKNGRQDLITANLSDAMPLLVEEIYPLNQGYLQGSRSGKRPTSDIAMPAMSRGPDRA